MAFSSTDSPGGQRVERVDCQFFQGFLKEKTPRISDFKPLIRQKSVAIRTIIDPQRFVVDSFVASLKLQIWNLKPDRMKFGELAGSLLQILVAEHKRAVQGDSLCVAVDDSVLKVIA